MVSTTLLNNIQQFENTVNEPIGKAVETHNAAGDTKITGYYLPTAHGLTEPIKQKVLDILVNSWNDNQDYNRIRDWGRAAINIANYCLRPTTMQDISNEMDSAIDSVYRISRWYYTNVGFYTRMRPYARDVVQKLWGTIDRWPQP